MYIQQKYIMMTNSYIPYLHFYFSVVYGYGLYFEVNTWGWNGVKINLCWIDLYAFQFYKTSKHCKHELFRTVPPSVSYGHNLQWHAVRNVDYVTLVSIFSADHVGLYQIKLFKNGNQSEVNSSLWEYILKYKNHLWYTQYARVAKLSNQNLQVKINLE